MFRYSSSEKSKIHANVTKRNVADQKNVGVINIKSIKRISQTSRVNNFKCPKISKLVSPKAL